MSQVNELNIKSKVVRNSEIELLRIISIVCLIGYHLNYSFNYNLNYVFATLQPFMSIIVAIFLLISGYYTFNSHIKSKQTNTINSDFRWLYFFIKLVILFIIVIFLSLSMWQFVTDKNISSITNDSDFLTFSTKYWYFFWFYLLLLVLAPIIVRGVLNLNAISFLSIIIFLYILGLVIPLTWISSISNMFGSTIVYFLLMFLIGIFICQHCQFIFDFKFINIISIVILIVLSLCNIIFKYFRLEAVSGFFFYESTFISPFLAILIFHLFKSMSIKSNVINWMATLVPYIFAFHFQFEQLWLTIFKNNVTNSSEINYIITWITILTTTTAFAIIVKYPTEFINNLIFNKFIIKLNCFYQAKNYKDK